MKGKYLITTDNWFFAPDGQSYKAVWGDTEILEDSFLGLKTNKNSSNWYAKVGSDNNHVIIAGCQIHYAVKCEKKPNINDIDDWLTDATCGIKKFKSPTRIYIAK